MPRPSEHKTVQARILACAQEIGWASVPEAIMYVDSIHYSAAGATVLAKCIVERAAEVGLLP
jgi:hypothetical protein